MNVKMMLCDVARVSEGKLDMLGAGWNVLRHVPAPFAIGMLIEVPWAETGEMHSLNLVLATDGGSVVFGDNGEPMFEVKGEFKSERQPGVLLGTAATIPMPLAIPPLPLTSGARYKWVLMIDGKSNLDWELPFSVAPAMLKMTG